MKLIYQNFDKLDMTFQGTTPTSLLLLLAQAKDNAIHARQSVAIEVGVERRPISVRETGSRGGYAYMFDTKEDRLTFAIKASDDAEGWNIRVFISSLMLATEGIEECLKEVQEWLTYLRCAGTQGVIGELATTISRVDYCFDYLAPTSFQPNKDQFLFHARSKKGVTLDIEGNSKHDYSFRIGKMPNKQVAIYNKSKEITDKHKSYWYKIWGIMPDTLHNVWRIEFRSGKQHLQKHGIRNVEELLSRIQFAFENTHHTIRYVTYTEDSNRSRARNETLWNEIGHFFTAQLEHSLSAASFAECKAIQKETRDETIFKQMRGLLITSVVESGYTLADMEKAVTAQFNALRAELKNNPTLTREKFMQAQHRKEMRT